MLDLNLRSEYQGALDANVVNERARYPARDNHEAKCQGVGRVDQVWLLRAAAAEGVHCTPYSWRREVAQTENGHVVKGGPVPSDCRLLDDAGWLVPAAIHVPFCWR